MPTRDEVRDVIDARMFELLGATYTPHRDAIKAGLFDAVATGIMEVSGGGGETTHEDTLNPSENDDETGGYSIGSRWINTVTPEEFVCCDATNGAAVWVSTTSGVSAVAASVIAVGVTAAGIAAHVGEADPHTQYVRESTTLTTTAPLRIDAGASADLSTSRTLSASLVVGDSGAGGTSGIVPAPGAGDAAANRFLHADGGWKKVQVSVTDRLLGRDTAGAGAVEELTVGGGLEFTGSGGLQRSAISGDVTIAAGSNTSTIGVVTTKGDLLGYDTAPTRVPIGTTGHILTVAAGLPAWAAPAPATALRETSGPTDLAVGAVADGQVLKRVGSTVVGTFLLVAVCVTGPYEEVVTVDGSAATVGTLV